MTTFWRKKKHKCQKELKSRAEGAKAEDECEPSFCLEVCVCVTALFFLLLLLFLPPRAGPRCCAGVTPPLHCGRCDFSLSPLHPATPLPPTQPLSSKVCLCARRSSGLKNRAETCWSDFEENFSFRLSSPGHPRRMEILRWMFFLLFFFTAGNLYDTTQHNNEQQPERLNARTWRRLQRKPLLDRRLKEAKRFPGRK